MVEEDAVVEEAGGKKKRVKAMSMEDVLHLIAPGTLLRESISAILQARNGALLCIGNEKRFARLSEGGIKVDVPMSPQLLYELCKMDGAIILSDNGERIVYANRFLTPTNTIQTDETGTRHRTAERMAKQSHAAVITLSERRGSVTVYCDQEKHVLDTIPTLLNKATQAMQTLEKYLNVLVDSLQELTAREFQDMVTIFDVCKAVQRCEMVKRIAAEMNPYLLELGTEGRLTRLQLEELVQPVAQAEMVTRDYFRERQGATVQSVQKRIAGISEDGLLQISNISLALGYGSNLRNVDAYLIPRGYRILELTRRLTSQQVDALVGRFGNLQGIMRASMDELCEVDGIGEVLAERLRLSLNVLRNQAALDINR